MARIDDSIGRLNAIYRHAEQSWNEFVVMLAGVEVRYLLIAEAPPWSEHGPPQFVLDPMSRPGVLLRALSKAFLGEKARSMNAKEIIVQLARRGFLLIDSIPFAMDYGSRRSRSSYQRLIDQTVQTYLMTKMTIPQLVWSPEVRVALAFKRNGEAVTSALGGRIRIGGVDCPLGGYSVAADGSNYPSASKLCSIYRAASP